MKTLRYLLIGVVVVFIGIQLVPNHLPETGPPSGDDLIENQWADKEIANIMKTSCYDCHSSETTYPWYSYIAPSSWLVKNDVKEGRKELNFSEWNTLPKRRQLKKLEEISEEVKEGHMPLPIYLIIHGEAKLSDEQRSKIVTWAKQAEDTVMSR